MAYSKGGAEAYHALNRINNSSNTQVKDVAKHVEFIGIGSAECIEEEMVKSAIHLAVVGDTVARSPVNFEKAVNAGTVKIITPDNNDYIQHYFDNPAYQDALAKILGDYKNAN